jgi:hypothetical protein
MRHLSHAEFALIRYRQEHDRVWRYPGLDRQIRTHYDHTGARVSGVKVTANHGEGRAIWSRLDHRRAS